jgi:hypothetical protein
VLTLDLAVSVNKIVGSFFDSIFGAATLSENRYRYLLGSRVSTKVLFLLSTKSEFRRNYSLISSKFRCFDFPKFRLRFRCRNRNSDFGFDSDFDFDFGIPIPILTSEFRFRLRNTDFDVGITLIKIESSIFKSNFNQCCGAASLLCGFGSSSCSEQKFLCGSCGSSYHPTTVYVYQAVLQSRINFMRLRVKILMRLRRLRLLPYCIARQNFLNELKFKHMLKLSCSYDSVRFVLVKI